ncbi:hypothetical protein PU629_14595 [Pullulanibacillus sp. KACC 23026]|uniref:YphA family membrane protein n=1 Tax=Pullulanibacillus sp. KACC 23026 TaxID=3028315 RepID=UPI0023AE7A3D|nr:hypothetical protein [Pullulanibacillus sp. KACC 23026]WEG11387.1 hypothetical protein PU629_14595 [Pullulanibacillus sp. KACC 23026]
MNNFWFYWALWGFWIIVVFFYRDGKKRATLSCLILLMITVSPFSVPIGQTKVNLTFLVFGLTGCGLLSNLSFTKVVRLGVASFIVMMLDVLAQIYWLYDPAILMILPEWTFILFMCFFILVLTQDFWNRVAILLIGMSQGECLQSLVFYPYDQLVGDTDYLVMVSFILILLVSWELTHQGLLIVRTATLTRQTKRIEK